MADSAERTLPGAEQPADLRAVLARAVDFSAAEVVDLVGADQVRRWRRGERVPAEAYLLLHPALPAHHPDAFELVYNEFLLREELGEVPVLAEFFWRFPQFEARLRRQVQLHRALSDDGSPPPPPGRPDDTPPDANGSADPAARPAPRPVVRGYEIRGELGRGGMGVVYLAWQTSLKRPVALKMIRDGVLADPSADERFRREAEAAARLRHPHIVQVYEVGEAEGHPFIALEYVPSGNLAQRTQGQPQPPVAAALVETLARAVHYAHQHGIVHRDLKPANILLSVDAEPPAGAGTALAGGPPLDQATPKITDFGLAKELGGAGPSTQSGAVVGTPGYMAPEQAAGQRREVGPPADVYALGAVLYELLTGRPPFAADNPLDTMFQVLHNDPLALRRLQPKVPRDLETICLKCLAKEPARRYASAADLADDLHRFRAGESIRARPAGAGERAVKWARRRPAPAALLGVSAATVLTLLAGGAWYSARLQEEVQRRAAKEAEALGQQQRAKAQYREARETIRRMLAQLDAKELAAVPEMLELRLRQVEDALAFYRAVLRAQDAPEPAVRLDAAHAYLKAAEVENRLGRGEAAREHAAQSETLFRALVEEAPANRDYAEGLVTCLNLRGVFDQWPGYYDQAERRHREALRRCREALEVAPDAPRWLYLLADTCRNLGNVELGRQRTDQADRHYTAMCEAGERLVRAHPDNPQYREMFAESHARLGHVGKGGPQAADAHFRQAEEQFQQLIREYPQQRAAEAALGAMYHNWAKMWDGQGEPGRALELLARGIARMEDLYRREPQYVQARLNLQALHGSRAYILGARQRFAEALPDWDRVIALESNEASRDFRRSERASVLAQAGDYARAMAEVEELAGKKGVEARTLYNAACAASDCSEKVNQDARLSAVDQSRMAERYAARAVELLARVRIAGLFPPAEFVKRLQPPNFPSLQGRPDFQSLVAHGRQNDR